MMPAPADRAAALPRIAPALWCGGLCLILLLIGLSLWAATSQIAGAVITSGRVEIAGGRYNLQHPDGGQLAEIHIQEGQDVQKGQLIARLDPTRLLAERASYLQQWASQEARRLRLQAELTGDDIAPPGPDQNPAADQALLARILPQEAGLMRHRRETLRHMQDQLLQRRSSAQAALQAIGQQKAAITTQLQLSRHEADIQQNLRDQGLAQSAKLYALQRDIARLDGLVAENAAEDAKLRGDIAQAETESRRLEASHREELASDLRQSAADAARLRAVLDMIDLRLAQAELRAPIHGRIFGLQGGTVGRVLAPAEVLAHIIPAQSPLQIWLHILPQTLHELRIGQKVRLIFPSLAAENQMLAGHIIQISPDVFQQSDSAQGIYRAEVVLDAPPADLALQAGLPLQAFIQTASQSPWRYLWSPAQRYLQTALRER